MRERLLTYFTIFLSGFLFTLAVVYYSEWNYEEDVLDTMAQEVDSACVGRSLADRIDTAMALTHEVVDPMADVYGNRHFSFFKDMFISPSFLIYYYGQGACGGYSSFTARLLDKMGINTKFVEQYVNGVHGGHITLVVDSGARQLLVDPMFQWTFRDSLGHLSDIKQVAANWSYYAQYEPPHYKPSYNYQEGWDYTNWDKFGVFSRALYKVCIFIWGKEKVDNYSFRAGLLGLTQKYFYLCSFLFICCVAFIIRRYVRYLKIQAKSQTPDSKNKLPDYTPQINQSTEPAADLQKIV